MATSIFGIGLSGLNAAQASLASTSHNITNSANGAFHRQTAIQGTQDPQLGAGGFFGKGATVETVVRSYDRFLEGAVLQAQGQGSYLDAYNKQITQIDNLLADPTSGMSPALQTFFSGVQDVASNPSSVPSRQAMISQANAMVSRFATFDSRFEQLRSGVNSEISDSITQINATAKSIADMNDQIIASLSSDSKPANDLLDKRDALVANLNKLIHTSVITESSGSISVFIGTGQTLVIGNQSYSLKAAPSTADPKDFDISYQSGGSTTAINASNLQGGSLGALLDFRTQTLDTVQNNLGRTAIVLAQTFNDQHRLGQDLNGVAGQNFFNVPTPTVLVNSNNTGTAAITATNTAVGSLTGSDYRLQFAAGNWTFTRLTDNTKTVFLPAAFPVTIDGITLASPSGTPLAGDSYLIQPTRTGSRDISVAITDTAKIAAAAPIRTNVPLTNTGSGTITAGTVNSPPPQNANILQPVTLTFTGASAFSVTGTGTGNPVGVAYTPGANITYNGWTVQVSGAPAIGDTFTISPNTNGVADNRNALLLAGLQTKNTVEGTANYQSSYSQLVSSVGNRAREIQVQSDAQEVLVQQATTAQQSLSGVNLDEEAANLIRFQQAYQASGKVLSVAATLFDTILGIRP